MKKVAVFVSVLFASLNLVSSASATAHGSARSAAMLKVCPDASKCFTSIQAAIEAAASGDKIKMAAGTYQGSLVIDKDITLDGAGAGETIITADATKRVITVTGGGA
jgi:pectin methylesterase-like acyl-CoA thioesterase